MRFEAREYFLPLVNFNLLVVVVSLCALFLVFIKFLFTKSSTSTAQRPNISFLLMKITRYCIYLCGGFNVWFNVRVKSLLIFLTDTCITRVIDDVDNR